MICKMVLGRMCSLPLGYRIERVWLIRYFQICVPRCNNFIFNRMIMCLFIGNIRYGVQINPSELRIDWYVHPTAGNK